MTSLSSAEASSSCDAVVESLTTLRTTSSKRSRSLDCAHTDFKSGSVKRRTYAARFEAFLRVQGGRVVDLRHDNVHDGQEQGNVLIGNAKIERARGNRDRCRVLDRDGRREWFLQTS